MLNIWFRDVVLQLTITVFSDEMIIDTIIHNSSIQVSPKDVASLEGKRALLLTLLDESDIVSGGQLVVLKNLLLSWPFSRLVYGVTWSV